MNNICSTFFWQSAAHLDPTSLKQSASATWPPVWTEQAQTIPGRAELPRAAEKGNRRRRRGKKGRTKRWKWVVARKLDSSCSNHKSEFPFIVGAADLLRQNPQNHNRAVRWSTLGPDTVNICRRLILAWTPSTTWLPFIFLMPLQKNSKPTQTSHSHQNSRGGLRSRRDVRAAVVLLDSQIRLWRFISSPQMKRFSNVHLTGGKVQFPPLNLWFSSRLLS